MTLIVMSHTILSILLYTFHPQIHHSTIGISHNPYWGHHTVDPPSMLHELSFTLSLYTDDLIHPLVLYILSLKYISFLQASSVLVVPSVYVCQS